MEGSEEMEVNKGKTRSATKSREMIENTSEVSVSKFSPRDCYVKLAPARAKVREWNENTSQISITKFLPKDCYVKLAAARAKAREWNENTSQISNTKYLPKDCYVKMANITTVSRSQLIGEERLDTKGWEDDERRRKKPRIEVNSDLFDQDTVMMESFLEEDTSNDYNENNKNDRDFVDHDNVIKEDAFLGENLSVTVSDDVKESNEANTAEKNGKELITQQRKRKTDYCDGLQSELVERKSKEIVSTTEDNTDMDTAVTSSEDHGMCGADVIEVFEGGVIQSVDEQNEEQVGQIKAGADSMTRVHQNSSEVPDDLKSNFIEISSDEDDEVQYIEQDLVIDDRKEVVLSFPLKNVEYTFVFIELETMLASNSKCKEITQIGASRENSISHENEPFFMAIEPKKLTEYLESYKLGGDLLQTLNMQKNDDGKYEFRKQFEIMEEGRLAIQCVDESEALEELSIFLAASENCIIVSLSDENIELLVQRMKILNVSNKKIHLNTVKGYCTWSAYLKADNASEEELNKDFEDWYRDYMKNNPSSQGPEKHANVVAKMVHNAVDAMKTCMGFQRDISRYLVKASRPIDSLQPDMASEEITDSELQYLEIFSSLRPDLPARISLLKLESYDVCSDDEDAEVEIVKQLKKEGMKETSVPDRGPPVAGIPTRGPSVTGVPARGPRRYQGPRNDEVGGGDDWMETGWGGLPRGPPIIPTQIIRGVSSRNPLRLPPMNPDPVRILPGSPDPLGVPLVVPIPTTTLPSPFNLFAARSPPLDSIPGELPLMTSVLASSPPLTPIPGELPVMTSVLARSPPLTPIPGRIPLMTSVLASSPPLDSIPGELPLMTSVLGRSPPVNPVPVRVPITPFSSARKPPPNHATSSRVTPMAKMPTEVSLPTPVPARAPPSTAIPSRVSVVTPMPASAPPATPVPERVSVVTPMPARNPVAEQSISEIRLDLYLPTCPICSKQFSSREGRTQHIIAKHNPNDMDQSPILPVELQCPKCYAWSQSADKQNHKCLSNKPRIPRFLECQGCHKSFKSFEEKTDHIQRCNHGAPNSAAVPSLFQNSPAPKTAPNPSSNEQASSKTSKAIKPQVGPSNSIQNIAPFNPRGSGVRHPRPLNPARGYGNLSYLSSPYIARFVNFVQNSIQNLPQNSGQNLPQNSGQNFPQNSGQNTQNGGRSSCNQSRGWLSSPRRRY